MLKKIKNRIRNIINLGATPFDFVKLFLLIFLFKINNKTNLPSYFAGWPVNIKFKDKEFIFYPTDNSDLAILDEIFSKEEYKHSLPVSPEVIIDLGSNVGLSVIYFKLLYPKARIYSVEPDPITFRKLIKNVAQFDNIFCFNEAVADRTGQKEFYLYPGSSMSSSFTPRISDQLAISVSCRSLDDFIEQEKIFKADLIKFDIEGYEMAVFRNFKKIGTTTSYIGEVHLDLMDETLENFLDLFNKYRQDLREISKGRRYSVFLTK